MLELSPVAMVADELESAVETAASYELYSIDRSMLEGLILRLIRVPTKSNADAGRCRTVIPGHADRSVAG